MRESNYSGGLILNDEDVSNFKELLGRKSIYGSLGHSDRIEDITHKVNSVESVKSKLPRKKKKAFIKKYGREAYHTKYGLELNFSLEFFEHSVHLKDLFEKNRLGTTISGLGRLDNNNNVIGFELKSVDLAPL